jgi:hypothetical protein
MINIANDGVAATRHKKVARMTPEEEERVAKAYEDIKAGRVYTFKTVKEMTEYVKKMPISED